MKPFQWKSWHSVVHGGLGGWGALQTLPNFQWPALLSPCCYSLHLPSRIIFILSVIHVRCVCACVCVFCDCIDDFQPLTRCLLTAEVDTCKILSQRIMGVESCIAFILSIHFELLSNFMHWQAHVCVHTFCLIFWFVQKPDCNHMGLWSKVACSCW